MTAPLRTSPYWSIRATLYSHVTCGPLEQGSTPGRRIKLPYKLVKVLYDQPNDHFIHASVFCHQSECVSGEPVVLCQTEQAFVTAGFQRSKRAKPIGHDVSSRYYEHRQRVLPRGLNCDQSSQMLAAACASLRSSFSILI